MKQSSYLVCIMMLALTLWACSQNDEPIPVDEKSHSTELTESAIRTPEEAIKCAFEAFSTFYGISRAIPVVKNVNVYGTSGLGRSEDVDSAFYIVNLEDNMGYAVIAASKECNPVLAVTESGNIENLDSIENPGARQFFSTLSLRPIDPNRPKFNGDLTTLKQFKEETNVKDYEVKPRANNYWGQSYPENKYMPNGYAGCGNVATVLTLSYFELPRAIKMDQGYRQVKWDVIKKHKYSSLHSVNDLTTDRCGDETNSSEEIHDYIGNFYKLIATFNLSKYHSDGTSTTMPNTRSTIMDLAPSLNVSSIKEGMPKAYDCIGKGIIMVRGETDEGDGHAFIIDGYFLRVITENRYERPNELASWTLVDTKTVKLGYNHINWGWNGMDNGYFEVNVFDPTKYLDYSQVSRSAGYGNDVKYFIVQPIR